MRPRRDEPSRVGRGAVAIAAALGALALGPAHACGACVEDGIAATYDHALAERARLRGLTVVYSRVAGPLDAARLRAAVRGVRGVDPASVRVSTQPAALSFVLDAKVQSTGTALASVQRAVPVGVRLTVVGVSSTNAPGR